MPLTPQDLLVIRRQAGLDGGIEQVQPRRFERVNAAVASSASNSLSQRPIVHGAWSFFLWPLIDLRFGSTQDQVSRYYRMGGKNQWVTSCTRGCRRSRPGRSDANCRSPGGGAEPA